MKFPSFAALRGEPLKRRRARFGAQPAAARPARNRREQKNPPGPRAVSRRRGALNRSEDGLGSVVATNDPAGTVSHSVVFDAWGNTKSEVGTRQHPFTYTGREVGEAGTLFYRARFYQTGIGRFTQEDPIGQRRPWGVENLYAYASLDPILLLDPMGLDAVTDDSGIQDCMYCIYRNAGFGNFPKEEAMFVVCNDGGSKSCLLWPSTNMQPRGGQFHTKFRGKIPPNTCGLIHTHPNRAGGPPSSCPGCDRDTATGLGMPVYSIHSTGVWKWDPKPRPDGTPGGESRELPPGWMDPVKERCPKPCSNLNLHGQ